MKLSKTRLFFETIRYVKVKDIPAFIVKSWFMDVQYEPCTMKELYDVIARFKDFIESVSIRYIVDNFDCDDYAKLFSAYASAILKKNSVGIAIGRLYYKGQFLGYHAWNIILSINGILFFEPQTLELFAPEDGSTIDGFIYELVAVIW